MTTTTRDTVRATSADQATTTTPPPGAAVEVPGAAVEVPGAAVEVVVNGERQRLACATSIAAVVDAYAQSRSGIAVARNRDVIPRSQWEDTVVAAGDTIEIVTAVAGG
ncbi:MAG: sulfur carrier protein ThiS [Actinomycetota bacterium]|nr:sulfur carrier protein ThiS [Actinomycetota bacterium]